VNRSARSFSILLAIALSSGCAGLPNEVATFRAEPGPCPVAAEPARGVVFCADGAGGFNGTTRALREALAAECVPLAVEAADWSHGYGRILADQMDGDHAVCAGRRLAQRVASWREACPGRPVYLAAHSAGSAVVLAAAECLPAGSVERIVLLAPAVSADYDLRPALRSARCGIDVFCSERDWALGLGAAVFGTTDRRWSMAAGWGGFRPVVCNVADAALYQNLHQHPWDPCLAWSGHLGGHYGPCRVSYLRPYVVPLLRPGE
jgi:pimeloyl-ACP methyl ester carboxylesterase